MEEEMESAQFLGFVCLWAILLKTAQNLKETEGGNNKFAAFSKERMVCSFKEIPKCH